MKRIFYSNYTPYLIQKLKENIFYNINIFEKHIFVPSKYIENFLKRSFCDDENIKISFGISFLKFSNFLNFIFNKISNERLLLSNKDIYFLLLKKLKEQIFEDDDLKFFLTKDERINQKKIIYLAKELSKNFLQYFIHAAKNDFSDRDNFIKKLYIKIFYEENTFDLQDEIGKINRKHFKNIELHFFLLDHIPKKYFKILENFENVHIYVLSPCKYFYDDILSDFEKSKFLKKLKDPNKTEIEPYFSERNSFLANMARVQKLFAENLNELENFEEEDFYLENEQNTILKIFQNDILNLVDRNVKQTVDNDKTIQIHFAGSKIREVEILYQNILNELNEDKTLKPEEIAVVSNNINDYAFFIEALFNNREFFIPYQIFDIQLIERSNLYKGFSILLEDEFDINKIILLLQNPLFYIKNGFTNEEIERAVHWIEEAKLSLGFNNSHAKTITENNEINPGSKTITGFLERLIASVSFFNNERYLSSSFTFLAPFEGINYTDTIIINKLIKVFSKIEKIIFENMKAVETIEYWQKFFNGIVDENFEIDQSVDIEVHNEIKNFVSSLNEVIKDEKFHFEEIFYSLEEHLKNKTFSINKNQIGAIEFFSLKNFKQNKKIVFILGLDEKSDIYKKENSLNIIKLNDIANEQDNQRSSFLRVILLTENKLILSLENKNQSEYAFSIILKELLSYLDNNFLINNEKFSKLNIFYHPLLSIDKKYFSKGNRHFMKIYFEAAQKYYCNCPVLNKSKAVTNEIDTLIKISDIRKFLKNPIKYYFQNVLKIYLEEEIGDTELALSYLDKYKILEDTKDYELENILNFLEKKSHLPVGPFSQIEKENLKKQYDLQLENLNYLNLKKHDFFTIDFNSKVSDYEKSFDPIIIDIEGKSYVLTGSVENISYKGILQNSEMDYFNIFKNVLDISLVKDISDKFQNNLIFLKSKKIKTFSDINRNESLKNILIYYIKFSKRPSFLIHNWFNPILKNNRELLSKAVDNTFSYKDNFIDPYMKLYIDTFEKPELAEILNDLQRYVKPICDVFPEMK